MSYVLVRYWRERVVGTCLVGLAFGVYYWTLCPSIFPGASALASVSVLRAWPGHEMVGRPIWHIAARLFCLLPLGEIPYRLNLFSALCGAGVVFVLFKVVTLILYDVMSEESWIRQIDDDFLPEVTSKAEATSAESDPENINNTGHLIAMAGGAVSSVAFAFSVPFWQASTSLHPQTFELLLLLSAGYAVVRYLVTSSLSFLVAGAFFLGLGGVESVVCLLFLPLSLIVIVFGGYRHGQISGSFVVLLFLGFAAGTLLAGAAQVVWITRGGVSSPVLIKVGALWVQSQADGVRAMIDQKGGLVMLAQGLLPLLIAYTGRHCFIYSRLLSPEMECTGKENNRYFDDQNTRVSKLSWNIIFFTLFVSVAHALLNLPGSPWFFSRESSHLPVMPLLGITMAFGFLFSYGLLFGCHGFLNPAKSGEETLPSPSSRMAYVRHIAVVVVGCSLIVVAALRNRDELDGGKACFVDLFCREILKAAPAAICFVTDGMFDMNLLVQARLQKRKITLLTLGDASGWYPSAARAKVVKTQTAAEFLRGWLSAHPEAASQVAMLTAPRLWLDAGLQVLPNKLVYLGEKPNVQINVKALMKDHGVFVKVIKSLLEGDLPRSPLLCDLRSAIRIQASRVTNDLGVLCLSQDAKEVAKDAFSLALDMDANNLCAWVNQCAPEPVQAETGTPPSRLTLIERIAVVMGSNPAFGSFSDWEKHYGALYLPAVEHLANLCNKVPEDKKPVTCLPVLRQSRAFVLDALQVDAEPRVPTQSTRADETLDTEVTKVVEALRGGYSKAAETQVRTLLRMKRASLVLWALLAEALMNQGKLAEVKSMVLPEMRFIAGDQGSEWIELTEGCLAMRQEKPDYRLAHQQFMRTLQRKPDIEEAQNLLIQTALLLRDQELLEADCKEVLSRSPRQPMANAALGALRLHQGRLEDAEKALSLSIASRPSSLALNDLGETWRRMQRFHAAEEVTRRALLLQPKCYQAWDTLALILMDQGRLDEASEAHHTALRLCQTDIRLYLGAAQLEQRRHDFKAVRQLLQQAAPLLELSPTPYKERYSELVKSLPE